LRCDSFLAVYAFLCFLYKARRCERLRPDGCWVGSDFLSVESKIL
jgi:hypothetical protein